MLRSQVNFTFREPMSIQNASYGKSIIYHLNALVLKLFTLQFLFTKNFHDLKYLFCIHCHFLWTFIYLVFFK